ncbi:MAG: TonB-dependent receptor [candidate division KSB1 bacterium]|nr:TonB-dependent receptor [candidate division KSB1 bacterium]MDZ7333628.1 TonB-dependent receptor [candidate division KSB1 bacterium]MDZ7357814.1 TonB-dependent receptor [candidate division KSB1 bacterium]MDZ7398742.1 TonB-dependent receptor [candidate division KSB1 bacterium]
MFSRLRSETKLSNIYFIFFFNLAFGSLNQALSAEFPTDHCQIFGWVIDETSQLPVANANLYFKTSDIGASSDEHGRFAIEKAPTGSQLLVVSHIGYQSKIIPLKLRPGESKKLNILLIPRVIKLAEVTSTASRHVETVFKSQMQVTIATRDRIAARPSPNTADVLREIPGVLVQKTTAGHGAPIIRGMIGKDVLLLYNGIRLNKPTFRFGANQYMNTINVETLDRIEVTKGPGSVMYGSDAIGGVVNMISELSFDPDTLDRSNCMISTRYGSADQARLLYGEWKRYRDKLALMIGLGAKKFGDLTAGSEIGKQRPTGYQERDANFKLGWFVNSTTLLEFDALTVQQEKVPRFDKYVTKEFLPGEYQTYFYDPQDRYLVALTLRSQPVRSRWLTAARWNWSYQLEQEGTLEQKTGTSTITRNRNDLTTYGSYLQLNSVWRNRHVFSYGYEFYSDRLKSQRIQQRDGDIRSLRGDYPNGSRYRSLGLFFNDNVVFNPQLDINLGIRWSYMAIFSNLEAPFGEFRDDYHDWTGTFGISYKPALWLNLIARYAKGFRAPNFNDTVVLKVSNAGVDAPSPGLSPEKSHNFELGAKINQPRWHGSLFVFYNRVVDLIDRYRGTYQGLDFYDENENGYRDAGEANIFLRRNVAKGYIAGWELEGTIQLSPRWNLRGWAFWTYGQDLSFNEPLSRIPPLMGLAGIQYWPVPKLNIEAYIRAADKQNRLSSRDIEDNRIPYGGTPGWKTFNIRLNGQMSSRLMFTCILENIFNETYKEHGSGVYSPGRGVVICLRYQI